jgi:hypothetical protein
MPIYNSQKIVMTPHWCRLTNALQKLKYDLAAQKPNPPNVHTEVRKCIDSIEDAHCIKGIYDESLLEEKLVAMEEYLKGEGSSFVDRALYRHFIDAMDEK